MKREEVIDYFERKMKKSINVGGISMVVPVWIVGELLSLLKDEDKVKKE